MGNIYFITGVSGSGKSTVGKALANYLNISFYDGDDFHPQNNIQKMAQGIALNDEDRSPWLKAINEFCLKRNKEGCIIACSALKKSYREILSVNLENVVWVSLNGSYDQIWDRMLQRKDHFMPAELLQSQFDAWETNEGAIQIDISLTPEEIIRKIVNT